MRDLKELPANLGPEIVVPKSSEPLCSVGYRKVPFYALNTNQKGGLRLETLT